ncbi:MAG: hypothetical protein ACI4RN_06460 [Oscillospiraceae bacterium]
MGLSLFSNCASIAVSSESIETNAAARLMTFAADITGVTERIECADKISVSAVSGEHAQCYISVYGALMKKQKSSNSRDLVFAAFQ